MKYLGKITNSDIENNKLNYQNKKDRKRIREILLKEQKGFCAYSERYVKNTDSIHIEHFDGRLKTTNDDNYSNWYGVLAFMNENKPKKIEPYLPILNPNINLLEKIYFEDNIFRSIEESDVESKNLIEYLGFNKDGLADDRKKHIKRLKVLKEELYENDNNKFLNYIEKHREELSFATAIENEFEIDLTKIINNT